MIVFIAMLSRPFLLNFVYLLFAYYHVEAIFNAIFSPNMFR